MAQAEPRLTPGPPLKGRWVEQVIIRRWIGERVTGHLCLLVTGVVKLKSGLLAVRKHGIHDGYSYVTAAVESDAGHEWIARLNAN